MAEIGVAKACLQRGDLPAAREHCEQILASHPDNADALHLLGAVLSGQRDFPSAILRMEAALRLEPDRPIWHSNLGMTCFAAERWELAAQSFARARALGRNTVEVLLAQARALLETGFPDAALNVYHEAECLAPATAGSLRLLGRIQIELQQVEPALDALRKSLELERNSAEGHDLIADLYRTLKHDEKAFEHYHASVNLQPNSARAYSRLAIALWDLGETAEAVALSEKALALDAAQADVRSGSLFILLHDAAAEPEEVAAAHRRWPEHHGVGQHDLGQRGVGPVRPSTYANSRDPSRRLKVGYLSGEFFATPCYYFVKPLLDSHDTEAFEIVCYNTRPCRDSVSSQFERPGLSWHEVAHLSAASLAERIREDRIDILVDGCGHFPYNRLEVFTRRPAPVQVAFPNYPSTTGLTEIDYLITDRWTDPPGMTESQYTEQLYRIERGYLPYLPPAIAPPATPLPAQRNGYVTFGLFQRPGKLNGPVWDAIAEAMRAVPDSRLLIHYSTRDLDDRNSRVCRNFAEQVEARGVPASRLDFEGAAPLPAHLDLLARADIAFDTFPYNGQTTTCECLWMGVPVVSLEGNSHVSRVGYGILHRAGLSDWVGSTTRDYVAIAQSKSQDLESLARLRSHLRTQMEASSLLDSAGIARGLEDGYRWMWRRWCE